MALSKAGFVLGIRQVDSLLPHEQVIPSHVRKISSEIKEDRVQKDPIIIDRESSAVLDGMHRLAAFKELEVVRAVVCAVNYQSNDVVLRRWARVYTPPGSSSPIDLLDSMGPIRRVTLAEAFSALENGEAGLAAMVTDAAYLPEGLAELPQAVDRVIGIDGFAEVNNWERTFVPEDEVDSPLQDKRKVVVLLRRLSKDDIVNAARTRNLFPCKSSMHIMNPRPVGINFPISELDDASSKSLVEMMKGKAGRLLPANSVYGGRRYKERLLLLDQG